MKDYKTQIFNDLVNLGVSSGDSMLVHSSLNSIDKFENRAQILIETFLQALGHSGTLLMPTLSYENVTNEHPVFDLKQTPSCVGGLTEYFRKLPNTQRSIHPTHSVCASGKNVEFFLNEHYLDNTPCGPKSPFRKLKEINGKILFLGCGLRPNTFMHAIEELSQPEYLFGDKLEYSIIVNDGTTYKKEYTTHNFKGFEQRYDRILDVLDMEDFSSGKILEADAYLIKTAPLWEKVNKKLTENPLYFVDKIKINDSATDLK